MWDKLKKYKLILASNSPRRKELLAGLGLSFTVKTLPDIEETFPPGMEAEEIPLHIAGEKARAYLPYIQPDELILTADTIVWLDGEVLGKPVDKAQARAMLKKLSRRQHQVITGVCLTTSGSQKAFTVTTEVEFSELTDREIAWYVDHYLPLDKAGAYGIQEWIGYVGVKRITGSFYNVMGLPVQRLYTELQNF